MHRTAAWVIGGVTAIRLAAALRLPLTPDEAYYWSWSRHLAYGYVDHPPMVAWFIAASSWLGQHPLTIRLPFIIALAAAALLLGRTATLISGREDAGAIAAIAFTLIPETKLMLGAALPDPPYLLFWSLALFCAVRAKGAGLGVALGGCLLSRFFGFALLGGIVAAALFGRDAAQLRRTTAIALPIALAIYAPFLVWNAHHDYANFAFTFSRQQIAGVNAAHFTVLSSIRYWIFAIAVWVVGYAVAIRPRYDLIAWTALPFPTVLAVLAFLGPGESYWILGPFASLCVGIGIALARVRPAWRRLCATLAGLAAAASAAGVLVLPSTAFAYAPLAQKLRGATVVTHHFEIAGELYYYGVAVRMAGPAPQTPMWNAWPDTPSGLSGGNVVDVDPCTDPQAVGGRFARRKLDDVFCLRLLDRNQFVR
jgi:4-amino-4-deoxy-L-arabinose transferase-like glycosyltransferase